MYKILTERQRYDTIPDIHILDSSGNIRCVPRMSNEKKQFYSQNVYKRKKKKKCNQKNKMQCLSNMTFYYYFVILAK